VPVPLVRYIVEIDTDRDGTFDNALDDVTEYVTALSWSNGIMRPYDELASVNRMRMVLFNRDRQFDVDRSGATYAEKLYPSTLVRVRMEVNGTGHDSVYNLRDGLVSWWTLDEASGTRADSHGSNDLTDNNTVGSAAGKQGNAADFESTNSEYLSMNSVSSLNFGDENFTLAGWVYINPDADLSTGTALIGKWDTDQQWLLWLFDNGTNTWARMYVHDGTSNNYVTADITTGAWHFIVGYHDSVNDEIGISIDGGSFVTTAHRCSTNLRPDYDGCTWAWQCWRLLLYGRSYRRGGHLGSRSHI
jgi:hypothetical protein